MTTDLYDQLCAAGQQIDSHESDLYVRLTHTSQALVRASGLSWSTFRSALDGAVWIDVPFAYAPFWRRSQQHVTLTRKDR